MSTVKQDADNLSVYRRHLWRKGRAFNERKWHPGLWWPFLKMVLACILFPSPHFRMYMDAAGHNLRRFVILGRCKRSLFARPRKAGNVMDYKLLQSPRNRPGRSYTKFYCVTSIAFPLFVKGVHVNMIIRCLEKRHPPDVGPSNCVSGCISYFTSVKHAFEFLQNVLSSLKNFVRQSLLTKQFMLPRSEATHLIYVRH